MRRPLFVLTGLALALVLAVKIGANSLLLDATTKSLEMETSSAASTDYVVSYADHTASAFTPGMNQGNVASATTTAILAAPGASTQRQVKWVNVRNRSTTTTNTITLKLDVSATDYHIAPPVALGPGEALRMAADGTLTIFTSSGLARTQASDISGYSGRLYPYHKLGTARDAAGYWIAYAKDAGFPGAYALGTPGLNGLATACDVIGTTAGALALGTHILPDPATGSWYLTQANMAASIASYGRFIDVLWFNTGIAVTTTTGQAITHPGIPARDINGSSNGDGVMAALLTTTTNTNAGAITNTTITYTDEQGNAGNTGTFAAQVGWQAPATALIGTFMPFQLAAGDRGIRSIQTVTLGTSYGAGALSLVQFRPLVSLPVPVTYVGSLMIAPQFFQAPGIRVYNDSCVWYTDISSSATLNLLTGSYSVMER